MLEAVIALFVLTSVTLLFLPLIEISEEVSKKMTINNQLELHTFLIQLQRTINQTKFIKVENNQLYLEEANVDIRELTVISKYKKMIRRQKNRGHEPLLMNISTFKLKEEENYLTVDILFTNGEAYQNSLFYEK